MAVVTRRVACVAVALAGLALAPGCGSPRPKTPLTSADLVRASIDSTDLPEGYAWDSSRERPGGDGLAGECPKARGASRQFDTRHASGEVGQYGKVFTRTDADPAVSESLASFRSGAGTRFYGRFTAALDRCHALTLLAPPTGQPVRVTNRRLGMEKVGDATAAFRQEATGSGSRFVRDVVLLRVADTLVRLDFASDGPPPPRLEQHVLSAAVKAVKAQHLVNRGRTSRGGCGTTCPHAGKTSRRSRSLTAGHRYTGGRSTHGR